MPAVPSETGADGERLFNQCKNCHDLGEGARHKVGPHLDGIIGRTAGSAEGFRYSKAMKTAGEEGLIWNADTISAYLEKPRDFVPGNRMSYRGMPNAEDRAALVEWLSSHTRAKPSDQPARSTVVSIPGFDAAILEMDGDPEYGEYLAGECVTCHQPSGHADGIPSIVGLPKDYFIKSLFEYRTNIRRNEVMKIRVQNLANEEIAALAAYFSSLEPQ